MRTDIVGEKVPNSDASKGHLVIETTTDLTAVLPTDAAPPRPAPLLPERSDFLEGDSPAAAKVEAFLAQAFAATGSASPAQALVPWICDALLSNHSVKAYGRDLMDFLRHMQGAGRHTAGGHRRPREALQAGAAGSRPDLGHGGTAAVGHPRRLQ